MPISTPADDVLVRTSHQKPTLFAAILFPALAAGLGWGIRGQYGHETGAIIAGSLTSLTLVLLFVPHYSALAGARAAAWMTVAIGIGGSMTYGQTVGLTHDSELVGHWDALRWGMIGLAVKGGVWIGFAGVLLGMGLSGIRYRFWELALVMLVAMGLFHVGVWVLNSPFDPANKILPTFYFSDSWEFEPGASLKPRPEVWGGKLFAFIGLLAYVRLYRGDRLALRLGLFAVLGGALGFPGGQCLQAYHAWNTEAFATSVWKDYFVHFNWWNMMETTFGAIWGGCLGLGLWLHRDWIPREHSPAEVTLSPAWEVALCSLHLIVLLASDRAPLGSGGTLVTWYTQYGVLMTVLPVAAISSGRFWPFLMVLPIAAAPIIAKSVQRFVYESGSYSPGTGWLWFVAVPMSILFYAATEMIVRSEQRLPTRTFAAISLLLATATFFGLNTVFFESAWPWNPWTTRTPNHLIFSVCAGVLVVLSLRSLRSGHQHSP